MQRILVALCEQEISSFNPVPTTFDDFEIHIGDSLIDAHRGADTVMRGALDVLDRRADVRVIPVFGAKAPSGGTLCSQGFRRIADGFLAALRERADDVDALYFSLHGAMAAEGELDPEGYLLQEARRVLGPRVPIVISLDLHGILTAHMLRHCNGIAVYWTYPHQDFVDTGERAARLLLRILDDGVRPVMARVEVPALVRGPELITATGCYGTIIRAAPRLERENGALAAAMMIGNPFTDVPELCSQSLVITDDDEDAARSGALALARDFWAERARMQASLVSLDNAIRDAKERKGPVTFTDAADAISSGASGDSNAILKGLLDHAYAGRAVMPVVDRPAAERAHTAGVGQRLTLAIGGTLDPRRFPPLKIEAEVVWLGDGRWRHQVSGLPADAGPTAVLQVGTITLIVVSNAVHMMDRAIFDEHGCDPETFDLIVVKSPGAYARFFTFAEKNYVPDIPGATTANLELLGHTVCARPIYPLDDDVPFEPAVEVYRG
jgi:microcystin degradation protein MlrC